MNTRIGSVGASVSVGESQAKALMLNGLPVWSRPGFAWREYQYGLVGGDAIRGMTYGGGQFVAVRRAQTTSGDLLVGCSPDGVEWEWSNAPAASYWDSCAHGGGLYVATASGASSVGLARSMYSNDGKLWRTSNIDTTKEWRSVCRGDGQFVAVGVSSVCRSIDGITWSTSATLTGNWRSVCYGNGRYVAVSSASGGSANKVATSADGISWTTSASPPGNQWYGVCFGNGLFVACGLSGTSRIMTSPDGLNWTLRTNPTGGEAIDFGSGVFVCGGTTLSLNGIDWTAAVTLPSSTVTRVRYGGGDFVLCLSPPLIGSEALRLAVSGNRAASYFYVTATEVPRVIESSSTQQTTSGDANVTRHTGQQTVSDYLIKPTSVVADTKSFVVVSSDTQVLSHPSSVGLSQYVGSGTATITATDSSGRATSRTLRASVHAGSSTDVFSSYRAGSLAASASGAIDSLATTGRDRSIFSTKNHTSASYVRNVNCWAHGLTDFSCVSVWNSAHGASRCGTLISPRHVIYAAHFPLSVGSSLRFVSDGNAVAERTISAKLTAPGYQPYFPDFEVAVLNADVPAGVGFARVLPSNWRQFLTSVSSSLATVPCVFTNQNEEALITEFSGDDRRLARFAAPLIPQRQQYFSLIISGDSGHPCFLVPAQGSPPVLLAVWTYGLSGSGTSVAESASTINSMMTTLGGGYQLTTADLSAFPTYN